MKKYPGIFRLLFASLVLFLGFVGSVSAVTPVSGCGTLNNAGETYVLQNDISASGDCFTIGPDNITLDGAGYSITGSGSDIGVYLNGRSGVTVKNLNISGFGSGIYLIGSSNNTLTNNTASNNGDGIYFTYSSSNVIAGNTVSNNNRGVALWSSSNSNTLTNNIASNNNNGISLYYSSNNTLIRNTANSNNDDGIYLRFSSNNILKDNTASNNWFGISLFSSSDYNVITNNTAKENDYYDVYVSAASDADCNNAIENNTGSGDRPIKYFNSSVSLQDEVLSELILCNADNSNIDNVTIEGSATKKNNGFSVIRTDYSNFTNINSSNNGNGIELYSSSNNNLTDNTASNNGDGIILVISSNYNTLTGNTASNNGWGDGWGGIYLVSSSNNIIFNNFFNNTNNFYLSSSINTWNTTKTSGTNLIGGPYLGGNFWAKPDGTGFSETCSDADGDGICDSNYMLATGNVDFLPLVPADTAPPIYSDLTPSNNSYTSDTGQDIFIVVIDDGSDVNAGSISMTVAGNYYDTNSGKLSYDTNSGLLSYYTNDGEFNGGQMVYVLVNVEDNVGNLLDVAWSFTVDTTSQTTVAIDNATAPPMGDVTVFLTIENVLDVGVADITLAYDRAVVQVLNVTTGDFDFMDAAIDNANGITRTGVMQMTNPGLNGSVVLANITLKAVGGIGGCSALNLSINELKAVGPPEADISATVVSGMFCIEETAPPSVTNPSANPESIPEDTDNDPTCSGTQYSEVSQLNVTVIDDSGVLGVTANLSAIGGQHDQPMTNVSDTWTTATSASIGSAIYNGTDYLPHYLRVNATDIYGNSNSSTSIPLTVIKNGDVNEDGDTTLYDAMYLAKNVLGKPGFETITPGVADVSGDCSKTLYDAMYLAKNVLGRPGFETLR